MKKTLQQVCDVPSISPMIMIRLSRDSRFAINTMPFWTIFILILAHCVAASGWDGLSSSLATGLMPLLSFIWELPTRQFSGESFTMLDYFISAMAPIGIGVILVSAIRVGG